MSFFLGNEGLQPIGKHRAEQLDTTRHMRQTQIDDVSCWCYGLICSPKMNFVAGPPADQHGGATIGIRPEHLRIAGEGEGWPGTVSVAEHLGSDTFLYVDAGALGLLTVRGIGEIHLKAGDRVWLSPDPARLHRFDKDGMAIRR